MKIILIMLVKMDAINKKINISTLKFKYEIENKFERKLKENLKLKLKERK